MEGWFEIKIIIMPSSPSYALQASEDKSNGYLSAEVTSVTQAEDAGFFRQGRDPAS